MNQATNRVKVDIEDVEAMAARIERLPITRYQIAIFSVVATAWLFDSIDLGAMTFLLGPIKSEFRLDTYAAGLVASASFLGMFFGASLSGILADRIGRKTVFQFSMIIWGIGSVLCGLSHTLAVLACCRILVGVGMGMEFPVAQAIASELMPKDKRGLGLAVLEGFWPLGLICAGFLTLIVLPHAGWRVVFILEGLPAIFLLVVRQSVPESPRWLVERGRPTEANRVMANIERRVTDAFGHPLPDPERLNLVAPASRRSFPLAELWSTAYRGRTAMVWLLWFFALLGYYGITTWLSALLQQKGFSITKSTEYVTAISFAGIPGFIAAALLLDRVGRKPVCVGTLVGGAISAFLYGHSSSVVTLIAFGALMQFFLFGMWSTLYAYTPELYPTRARATGAGWASAMGRAGSLIGPVVVGAILPAAGQAGVFGLGAGALLIAAMIVGVGGIETRGRVIEEISA
jgi:putative MFS transporter